MLEIKNEGIVLEPRDLPFEAEGVLNPACAEKDGVVHMFYRAVAKGNYSTVGHCVVRGNQVSDRSPLPIMVSEYQYESHGIEDPRITLIDGTYYMLYTAYDGNNAVVAYATSRDLINFGKKGVITPQISYDEAEDMWILKRFIADITETVFICGKKMRHYSLKRLMVNMR